LGDDSLDAFPARFLFPVSLLQRLINFAHTSPLMEGDGIPLVVTAFDDLLLNPASNNFP
jgi:hypothetical protein